MVAYKPQMAGTPEATAYATPTGTSTAVNASPAVTSWRSQAIS